MFWIYLLLIVSSEMHSNEPRSNWRSYVDLWSVLCKYLDITELPIKDGYEISM